MRLLALAALFSVFVITCISGCVTDKPDPAAYADIPPDKAKVIMAAHYAIEQEQYILNDEMGRGAGTLKLLHIAKAEQQIGAEIRYRLQLKVTLNGEEFNAETVVGWEKWGSPSQFKLVSWEFQ